MQQFIGLSWTRPVPWQKFHSLAADIDNPAIDRAARRSRTIRYQRDLIRRYVQAEGGALIKESALIDLQPDRATPEGMAALRKIVAAQAKDVIFVYVDFSTAYGWRSNRFLAEALRDSHSHPLYPDPLIIDGRLFDPIRHFRSWRDREQAHIQAKADHAGRIMAFLSDAPQRSNPQHATALNAEGLPTHGGKPWTADNLRKFRKIHSGGQDG